MLSVDGINNSVRKNADDYVLECENVFRGRVSDVAQKICEKSGRRIVMLAGPSSSGKTTTASIIRSEAEKHSRNAVVISLDDFYRDQSQTLYFEDGTPDFETIEALDIQYLSRCLPSLFETGKCMAPKFDFVSGKRDENLTPIEAGKDDIIIVEGLHAINPKITGMLEESALTKVYVSVSSRVFKNGEVWFSKREVRLIRRIIRDYHFRNSGVDYTFIFGTV